jgi:sec-independent protein translocase protein TatC
LEIKYRFFFSLITWSFLMINCYYFKETLLYIFMRFSFKSNNNNLLYFLTTDVAEVFIAYIQLSSYIANQITMIFLWWHCFLFLSTGLYRFEYVYWRNVIITTVVCWIMCIFMLNYFIFPNSWDFFLRFQEYLLFQNLTFHFEIKLNEYLIFYKSIYYLCCLIFQATVFFFIFLDLFRTNVSIIKKLRKICYFLFFIFATFVTPPEVLYQLAMSIGIILIYELLIIYMIFKTKLEIFK